jgi:hypothetical protein
VLMGGSLIWVRGVEGEVREGRLVRWNGSGRVR